MRPQLRGRRAGPVLAGQPALAADTCQSLKDAGLLTSATLAEQAAEAQRTINDYGILHEQNFVQPSHWLFQVPQASASPTPTPTPAPRCSTISAATPSPRPRTDSPFEPVPLARQPRTPSLFGTGQRHPADGRRPARQRSLGRRTARNDVSVSPTFNRQDQNVDRRLVPALAGHRLPRRRRALAGAERAAFEHVREGVAQIRADRPAGRHPDRDRPRPRRRAARPQPHLAPLLRAEPPRRRRAEPDRYYEVLTPSTSTPSTPFPDLAARFVPLHHYFIRGARPAVRAPDEAARSCRRAKWSAPSRAAVRRRPSRPPTCPRQHEIQLLATGSRSMGGRLLFRIRKASVCTCWCSPCADKR